MNAPFYCLVGLLVAGLWSSVPGMGRPAPCLRYEPDTIEVRGLLTREVFPGRPNFRSVAEGDEPEPGFYLHLEAPLCFEGDTLSPDAYPQAHVRLVQLNLDSTGYARLRPYLGSVITVQGTAYAAHTGHHHAPVVLWLDRGPLPSAPPSTGPGPRAIVGHWRGTSTCARANWNTACKDEVVAYDFVPAAGDSMRLLLHAAKLAGRGFEPMYDLAFVFSPDSGTWDGDFANARGHIRWSYRLRNDSLFGVVRLLPDRRVGRHVVATRSPGH